jgi:hypothetical protein
MSKGSACGSLRSVKRGIAYVYEDDDIDHFLTGRFDAHWEDGHSDGAPPRLVDASFEEALEWARARAPDVVVSFGSGERYSAGEEPDPEFPPLPDRVGPFVPRRDPEFAYMDRTEADPAVLWDVSLSFALRDAPLGDFAARFAAAVRADPRVADAEGEVDGASSRVEVDFRVTARGYAAIQTLVDEILRAAIDAARPGLPRGPARTTFAGVDIRGPAATSPAGS